MLNLGGKFRYLSNLAVILLILQIFLTFCTVFAIRKQNYPICIVGAGFSGLGIGSLLKDKGYDVRIFEAKNRVGGKAETFRIGDSVLIDKGAFFFSNSKAHPFINRLIEQFGLTRAAYSQTGQAGFEPTSGFSALLPVLSTEEQEAQNDAITRFENYRNQYISDFDYGYLNASKDLFLPMADWLELRNLTILTPIFVRFITIEGYGDLCDVPALYVLKLTNPAAFPRLRGTEPFFILPQGIDVLPRKMAESLNVFLNHEAVKIHRISAEHQKIDFKDGIVQDCNKIILAFSPLLKNLEKLVLDMTNVERNVLQDVRVHKYISGGHHIPSLNLDSYIQAFKASSDNDVTPITYPVGNGEILSLVKQSSLTLQNVFSSYSWIRGDFNKSVSDDDLQKMTTKLKSFLYNVDPAHMTYFVQPAESYFPHVTPESLRNNFYQKFEWIQGTNGLYYGTTLLTFEIVEGALEMANEFVTKYFEI